jgi:hypothetical protein
VLKKAQNRHLIYDPKQLLSPIKLYNSCPSPLNINVVIYRRHLFVIPWAYTIHGAVFKTSKQYTIHKNRAIFVTSYLVLFLVFSSRLMFARSGKHFLPSQFKTQLSLLKDLSKWKYYWFTKAKLLTMIFACSSTCYIFYDFLAHAHVFNLLYLIAVWHFKKEKC